MMSQMYVLPQEEQPPFLIPGPISILELRQVKEEHLPDVVVRAMPEADLDRRKMEIDSEFPHFEQETAWVVNDEKLRRRKARHRAAQPKLRLA